MCWKGRGSTQMEFTDGSKRSFEWGPKAMFAIPLNAKYRHFNGSGKDRAPAREHHRPADDDERLPQREIHLRQRVRVRRPHRQERVLRRRGATSSRCVRGNHMWETNFVPDLSAIELKTWGRSRRPAAPNIMFVLGRRLDARAHFRDAGRHLQEGASPRGRATMFMLRHRPRLFAAVVRHGQDRAHRLEARRRLPARADNMFHQHFKHLGRAGALSRHHARRPALSRDLRAAPLAARR